MGLEIRQVYGQIGIDTYRAWMDINQTPPKAHIEQRLAQLEIDRRLPKVEIDQSQCFAESGLKPALEMAHDFYDEGLEGGFEAIGRIAEEGTRLAAIENGANAIADIAFENSSREYDFNAVQMPRSRPNIKWDMGYLNINWQPRAPKIEWETYTTARISATEHKVDIYMKQWPSIEFRYVGNNIDKGI